MNTLSKVLIILFGTFSFAAQAEVISDSVFHGTDSRDLLDGISPGAMSSAATYGYGKHIGKTINMSGNIGNATNTITDYTQFSISATVNSSGIVFLRGSCSTMDLSAFDYPYKKLINNEVTERIKTATRTTLIINNYVNTELLKLPPVCEFKISPAGLSVLTSDKASKVFYNGYAQWAPQGQTITTYSKNNRANAVVSYQ